VSLSPEILEPVRRQGRIDRRARDRAVPEPTLDRLARAALPGQPQVGTSPRWLIYAQPRLGLRAVTAYANSARTEPHQGSIGRSEGSGLTN
jgi:hypothetical protein